MNEPSANGPATSQNPAAVDPALLAELVRREVRGALADFFGRPAAHPRQLNYEHLAYVQASMDSAKYLINHMLGASDHVLANAVREHALKHCAVSGLMMEFGVFDGGSLKQIAASTQQDVHGFDSFEGLPEDWTHFQKKGRFSLAGVPPPQLAALKNVRLHKGWFQDTLPGFLKQHPGPARFVHIDCDLYSSTKTVLDLLADRIVPGTVIVFDEYLNYPGWQEHERKAFAEFVVRTGAKYKYLGFASGEFSVSVQIL
jgi:Macrocin-O-methyltransferase (TylF)